MKPIIIAFVLILSISIPVFAHQTYSIEKQSVNTINYPVVFWTNFAISAIGAYSIYGIGAGVVSVGITYFVVQGDKKAMRLAIWGALLGLVVGIGIRILTLI